MDGLDQQFEGHGRRWAHTLLEFLRVNDVEIPSDWPGTAEQAETLVRALTREVLAETERARLTDAVQCGASAAWREMALV
jgi:hypothetical protein